MRVFSTYIIAVNPQTNELCKFSGQNIQAPSKQWAREYCDNNGLGFLFIDDEVVCTIPCKKGTYDADFDNAVDYYTANNN